MSSRTSWAGGRENKRTSILPSFQPIAVKNHRASSAVIQISRMRRPTTEMGGSTTRDSPDQWARIAENDEEMGPGLYSQGAISDGSFAAMSRNQPLNGMTREYIALKNVERRIKKLASLYDKKEQYGFLTTTEELVLRQEFEGGKYHELVALHRSLTAQVEAMKQDMERSRSRSPSRHSTSSSFKSSSQRFGEQSEIKSLTRKSLLHKRSFISQERKVYTEEEEKEDEKRPVEERMPWAKPRAIPAPTFWPGQGLPLASQRKETKDISSHNQEGQEGSGEKDGVVGNGVTTSSCQNVFLLPEIGIVAAPKTYPSMLYALETKEKERKRKSIRKQVEALDDWEFKHLTRMI